jgi:hypothetical protein
VIDLIAIRNTDPGKILQKFPGMGSVSGTLVLIQNDLFVRIHISGTVDSHITFGSRRTAVTVYEHRCLIGLDDMVIIQFPVEYSTSVHPVQWPEVLPEGSLPEQLPVPDSLPLAFLQSQFSACAAS